MKNESKFQTQEKAGASGELSRARPASDVELVALTKRYGKTTAVDAISLRIPASSYCCLLGPSGCGKTTTLRMIAGHEAISEGDILIHNRNVTLAPALNRGTSMMFQSYALFPHLSALDNVAFSLKLRGVKKAERHAQAMTYLDLVQMKHLADRMPSHNYPAVSSSAWRSPVH